MQFCMISLMSNRKTPQPLGNRPRAHSREAAPRRSLDRPRSSIEEHQLQVNPKPPTSTFVARLAIRSGLCVGAKGFKTLIPRRVFKSHTGIVEPGPLCYAINMKSKQIAGSDSRCSRKTDEKQSRKVIRSVPSLSRRGLPQHPVWSFTPGKLRKIKKEIILKKQPVSDATSEPEAEINICQKIPFIRRNSTSPKKEARDPGLDVQGVPGLRLSAKRRALFMGQPHFPNTISF